MGKKRIVKKASGSGDGAQGTASGARMSRKRLEQGILHIEATFNNTKLLLSSEKGDAVLAASSGSQGFSGARKGTPFAAAKVGELLGEKAKVLGLKDVRIIIRGVGSGRESAVRSFVSKSGANISTIEDRTPIPFNGPRPPKPRRV